MHFLEIPENFPKIVRTFLGVFQKITKNVENILRFSRKTQRCFDRTLTPNVFRKCKKTPADVKLHQSMKFLFTTQYNALKYLCL